MDSKERVIRTLEFNYPDRIPVQSWHLPSVEDRYGKRFTDIVEKYDVDFYYPDYKNKVCGDERIELDTYVDGWGCVWHNRKRGMIGEVKEAGIPDLSKVKTYRAPKNLIAEGAQNVAASINANKDKFILAPWAVDIFERMQHLRTTEELFVDLMEESNEIMLLKDIVFDFYVEWVKFWIKESVDGIVFSDDWGTQKSLLISPAIFRKIFKPMYRELINMVKDKGKYVFFHSDGNIKEILDDFVELGVDAINCQLWIMGIDYIAERYKGRITFWGELDRQNTLSFGKPEDVRCEAEKMKNRLRVNDGGLIGVCSPDDACPLENIIEGYKCWND